jgi:hypothetical protein
MTMMVQSGRAIWELQTRVGRGNFAHHALDEHLPLHAVPVPVSHINNSQFLAHSLTLHDGDATTLISGLT